MVEKTTKSVLVQYEYEVIKDDGFNFTNIKALKQEDQNYFLFAYFKKVMTRHYLVTVDNRLNLFVYDVDFLFSEQMTEPVLKANLIEDARLFDYKTDYNSVENFGLTKQEVNRYTLESFRSQLLKNVDEICFHYDRN